NSLGTRCRADESRGRPSERSDAGHYDLSRRREPSYCRQFVLSLTHQSGLISSVASGFMLLWSGVSHGMQAPRTQAHATRRSPWRWGAVGALVLLTIAVAGGWAYWRFFLPSPGTARQPSTPTPLVTPGQVATSRTRSRGAAHGRRGAGNRRRRPALAVAARPSRDAAPMDQLPRR